MRALEDKALVLLIGAVSLLFGWILWPFFGAILWATILAILFAPLSRRLLKSMPQRRNAAALATLLIIVVLVLLPLMVLANLLVRQAAGVYQAFQSGGSSLRLSAEQIWSLLPTWLIDLLKRIDLPNFGALREKLSAILMESGQFLAGQAINFGQSTVDFVISVFLMLYLLFFLLRDGSSLTRHISEAVPLYPEQKRSLARNFTVAIRAMMKGSIIVALVQGALGGLIFWILGIQAPLLWGALMAILSLLPVVGTGLVWVPVAIYFLATGAFWQGVVLTLYGGLVISLVDNILRPVLVGKDTKIPDYVVLVSTLGGLATFGANGIIIGPLVAAMFIAAWSVFSATRQRSTDDRTGR
ncbi:AI-2E family transporter [Microvirga brassicacearum]|uniref:AI-2E family transporter n=1 Tax=Microvirga brassicacearum TaxID=2580413 RepID=A0A5N3P770_9HYPH|nr:AI-2E family transporter [Microvirga brassicacearum]KAB0265579.1 AI-2E family transporter [Microvirga brassicacearum]